MTFKKRKSGLTVVELLVVIGIIAVVVAISLPAFNAMQKSFDSTGAEGMISAALSTARTLAISRQQYVGVRFQKEYSTQSILDTDQYMIFVIYKESKEMGNLGDAFHAINGYKPMKLPSNIGVLDMKLGNSADIASDGQINEDMELRDTTAFSIVFSPAGKLVIHDVQTRNKDGKDYNDSPGSEDNVFNIEAKVENGIGMFVQDDDDALTPDGLDKEQSRNCFRIYNAETLKKLNVDERYDKYIKDLPVFYINPYTGGIIENN